MSFPPCPEPPDWQIDWPTLDQLSWIRDLQGCPQHPIRHAEGDVWTHVHMVCEAMAASQRWRSLPQEERQILFAAALLHDVAKPACTQVDPTTGDISSRGHSWRGAVKARHILWRRQVPFHHREQVSALVRHHLVPFFLSESENPRRLAIEVSQTTRCDHLAILAEADARGRICPEPDQLLMQVELFQQACEEYGTVREPFPFPNDHARFLYFRDPTRQPDSPAYEEFGSSVVIMSGLPAVGKDHWLRRTMPDAAVISLDAIRSHLRVAPNDPKGQGMVLNHARDESRQYLRAGLPFIWNATNLSRHIRRECIRLFADYNAHVRIVYVEVPYERLIAQNRQRRRSVPERVIQRLLDRWEVPDRSEAHVVDCVINE